MKNFFKQLFCKHEAMLIHLEDVYGERRLTLPRMTVSIWQCPKCGKILYKEYFGEDIIDVSNTDMGEVSDGFHTFNDLYDHRAKLFALICHNYKNYAWKSKKHHDGSMYDDMFIVGIDTPNGQATYHYDIDKYWALFDVKELERAPKWDGHTSDDAIERVGSLKMMLTVDAVRMQQHTIPWDDAPMGGFKE